MCVCGGKVGEGGPEYEECDQWGGVQNMQYVCGQNELQTIHFLKYQAVFFNFFTRIIWTQFEENRLFGHFLLKIAPIWKVFQGFKCFIILKTH